MSICLRYSNDREQAIEILNEGFFKVFVNLNRYTKGLSFKGWIRKIMVNTAIDYFRKNEKHFHSVALSFAKNEWYDDQLIDRLSEQEIIKLIQLLPPSYRSVFNLHVIEGYTHEEIARKLNISIGTSKSNLFVARTKLQRAIRDRFGEKFKSHG